MDDLPHDQTRRGESRCWRARIERTSKLGGKFLSKKSMSGKRRRRRLSKKEYEQLERKEAELESDARSESEDRQERIKVLWDAITSGELAQDAKDLADNELIRSLTELAQKQKCEIEYLGKFRRELELIRAYYPEKLDNLSSASVFAALQPLIEKLCAEEKPNKEWERKRGRYRRLIECEFGGDAEANLRKSSLFGLSGLPYQPSCLDDILRGGVGEVKMQPSFFGPPIAVDTVTNMRRLQDLFGMHRDRFPKEPRGRRMGTKIVYDWCAVLKIMDTLLSERCERRKRSVRGRPRTLWLSHPDLCNRVLSGIKARINSISVPKEIATAFLDLVRRHRVDSAKK